MKVLLLACAFALVVCDCKRHREESTETAETVATPAPVVLSSDAGSAERPLTDNELEAARKQQQDAVRDPAQVDTAGTGVSVGRSTAGASVKLGATIVNGRLPREVIERIIRQNFGRFRLCYQKGKNAALQGRVTTKFVIGRTGDVQTSEDSHSTAPDATFVTCVVHAFSNLSFPQPEGGIVTVVAPLDFAPA